MKYEEPIKIVIPVEEEPVHKPAEDITDVKTPSGKAAGRAAAIAAGSARKAWESDLRKKATDKLNDGFNLAAAKGTELVRDRVAVTAERQTRETVNSLQSRIESGEWRDDAKSGLSAGLGWLSAQLADLSHRVTGEQSPEKTAKESESSSEEPTQ